MILGFLLQLFSILQHQISALPIRNPIINNLHSIRFMNGNIYLDAWVRFLECMNHRTCIGVRPHHNIRGSIRFHSRSEHRGMILWYHTRGTTLCQLQREKRAPKLWRYRWIGPFVFNLKLNGIVYCLAFTHLFIYYTTRNIHRTDESHKHILT